MPITLVTGPANAGKAQVLLDAVRRHLARGEEPILVVPTRADGERYQRELARDRAVLGLRVERFDGLIAEAVRRAGPALPVLGGPAREELLARLAADHMGGQPSAGSVRALGEFTAELQVARVAPGRLVAAFAAWEAAGGAEASAAALGAVYASYRAALERMGRTDREQRAAAALDRLRREPARWGASPVVIYGFDDLTVQQLDAIETLGRVVDAPVTVSLTFEPGRAAFAGRAGTFAQLEPLASEHRALEPRAEHYAPAARAALGHLERSLFEPAAARVAAHGAVALIEGADERAELELVAARVASLIAAGAPPEEIAVVQRFAHAGQDLLEEVFARAGVPFALQRRRTLGGCAIGRALLGLLRCVPSEPPPGSGRGADAPGSPPEGTAADLLAWLRAPGLFEHERVVDALELAVRRAGARSAAEALALWEQRHAPLASVAQLAEAQRRGPRALLDRAARELRTLFAAPHRRSADVLGPSERAEASALAAALAAIADLRELAEIDEQLAPAGARELARSLERVRFTSGERPASGLVAVLDPLVLRARRVRALFVCGMQEGVFPAPAPRRPMLAEEERRALAQASGLLLATHEDQLAAERYLLYALAARPEELLVLSWHARSDTGEPSPRSLFVDDVCDLFDHTLETERAEPRLAPIEAPSFESQGVRPLSSERVLEGLRGRVWSASALERWIGCPVRWFVDRLLAPQALEADPEPLARGSLAHAALQETLERLAAERGSARVTPQSLPRALELLAEALERAEAARPLSSVPERRPGARRRLRADLERYLRGCAASPSPLEPRAFELAFGFEAGDERSGGTSLPAADLGGGLLLRGRIDRVDVGEQREAVVYDYKGAVVQPAAKWLAEGSVQVALYMLAAEALLDVHAAGGLYQPLSGTDMRARGALEAGAQLDLGCVAGDVLERTELRELLERALALSREAASQCGRGELEPRPSSCGYDGRCTYPTICRCER